MQFNTCFQGDWLIVIYHTIGQDLSSNVYKRPMNSKMNELQRTAINISLMNF